LGVFISWNGGKDWSPFQLNLPVAPITDLRIHQGDLIAATSGRSFWILDDLSLIRQYQKELKALTIFQPENAYLANGRSELDKTDDTFTGSTSTEGVNPANGIVVYYHLPQAIKDTTIFLEIKDAAGNLVRKFSSKKDSLYKKWDGGPPEEPGWFARHLDRAERSRQGARQQLVASTTIRPVQLEFPGLLAARSVA
jgi:hypothetical protein